MPAIQAELADVSLPFAWFPYQTPLQAIAYCDCMILTRELLAEY
ncbi:MAG: hypothetical protein ACK56W_22755 [Pirellula sp.]|jgi:hypothetical protein